MTSSLPKNVITKLEKFRADRVLREKFERSLEKAGFLDILQPARNPDVFPREFRSVISRKSPSYPLLDHELRSEFLEIKMTAIARGDAADQVHPALAYYYLSFYQDLFKPALKKKVQKKAKKKTSTSNARGRAQSAAIREEESQKKTIFNRIQRIKRKLKVSEALKKARSPEALHEATLAEFQNMTVLYRKQRKSLDAVRSELEMYRNPDYMHPEIRKTVDDVMDESAKIKIAFHRERNKTEALEREVHHLAEQIISTPGISKEIYSEAAEELRREYAVLSQKYDSLVSKNIELVNRLESMRNAKGLEKNLDLIRDKINGTLRVGSGKSEASLLRNIKAEIEQLQRARTYLGRALYDVGLLYLRMGRKREAVTELRAARELGIEDIETNKLINS